MELTVGFIGGGNMGRALSGGLSKRLDPSRIHVADMSAEKRAALTRDFGLQTHEGPGDWVKACTMIVLAVKPQNMKEALAPYADLIGPKTVVLTIAAGIGAESSAAWRPGRTVQRAMPNTPARGGCGVTGLWVPEGAPEGAAEAAEFLLSTVGEVVRVDSEAGVDLVGAIPGSGPAYVFRFLEALAAAGMKRGLPKEDARALALGTVYGAAVLAKKSGEDFGVLRQNVTSKGGTTARALEVFNRLGIDEMVDEAVQAALDRTAEMRALFK